MLVTWELELNIINHLAVIIAPPADISIHININTYRYICREYLYRLREIFVVKRVVSGHFSGEGAYKEARRDD